MKLDDVEPISEIYDKHFSQDFSLPDLRNTIGNGVIIGSRGEIIAFGMVKVYPEAIIIIDKDKSLRDKSEALKLLFVEALKACRNSNFNKLVANTIDPGYTRLLEKHFNFIPVPGQKLYLDIEE